jgi:rhamnulokinase
MILASGSVAAVDLGATSGRVMLGRFVDGSVRLEQVARFPNGPVSAADGLHWGFSGLLGAIRSGLAEAMEREPSLASIGIDSWAVDYGLVKNGSLLGEPFHYRDDRTATTVEVVHREVSAVELYERTGLQQLPFTTLFQLEADRVSGALAKADTVLLIPDLIAHALTGASVAERTNASTTGLFGVSSREWDHELIDKLGLKRSLFPPLVDAGTVVGTAADFGGVEVTTVGSHDTASAVVGVPATSDDFAYISCGTWGLVGVELFSPVLTAASREANFTNEGGVDGRIRYLHNVMGLWLLSESVRDWEERGDRIDLTVLLTEAAAVTADVPIFDADDPTFLAPGDMPARIAAWFTQHGIEPPRSRPEFTRSIVESLAETFARSVWLAAELSSRTVSVIHLVGGGSLNSLLCQSTADRSGLPVLAGPVEATALGNVLVQARATGLASGTLEELRRVVAASFTPREFLPRVRSAR